MHYIKKTFFVFVLLAIGHMSSAQAPNWTVTASDYQYTMTITAFLNVEGVTLTSERDMVGAFVGNEIRGVANLIYVESVDRYLAYLTVYANQIGEKVGFRIYDSGKGSIVPVDRTLDFAMDEQYGGVLRAFSIASPALNGEAGFYEFGFSEVEAVSTEILEDRIDIVLKHGQYLTGLIPEFMVSDGARVYVEETLQISAEASLDFTFPIVYTVLSEDESAFNTYQVAVSKSGPDDMAGFSSTNVVTANNDGSNDFWIVQDAYRYADHTFRIFDANGRVLWESIGYNNDWDGSYQGKRVDRGRYYFTVENKEKGSLITGSILVLY